MLAIGLMSGTSLDGIDCSLIDTDGYNQVSIIDNLHFPYTLEFQHQLKLVISGVAKWYDIEHKLTLLHADIVNQLLQNVKLSTNDIKVIGFHGQTIYHCPKNSITWQAGNPHILLENTKIKVVSDFRRRDIANGGQGAPLVPIFHKCLMQDENKPIGVLNIGGISNISYIDDLNLCAFDVGCGNALINDTMIKYYNTQFDYDGEIAKSGTINHEVVDTILKDDFFTISFPKSLDRNYFNKYNNIIEKILLPQDKVATLTHLTVRCIIKSLMLLPRIPKKIFVCGGGVKNSTIMQSLNINSYNTKFIDIKQKQLIPEFIEAQAFAYLAVRYLRNLPSSFPTTTGVRKPMIAGVLFS